MKMVFSWFNLSKSAAFLNRLKGLLNSQRFNHTLVEGGLEAQLRAELSSSSMVFSGEIDSSRWKKMDSRNLGIKSAMIPWSPWIVLKCLRGEGFEAYLVGGCVRDLLLKKIPKDFDVVTTADLHQIKRIFHRCQVVGRRFPICRVNIKGSIIEVSSFDTVATHDKEKEGCFHKKPRGCAKMDFILWKNCIRRDFTVNSLFYDPFGNKVYDYAGGIEDLTSLMLRTLIPANVSFKEDSARILRGLRIAARLGLSFSKDTEAAILNLYSSIKDLEKQRVKMELNYMLSYGAAESSLVLLQRFKLLEIFLPFHAAYVTQQSSDPATRDSMMLMKLFSNLDKVVSCNQPCDGSLWICLLAFHLALVTNPQDPLVVWTFSSVLYHGRWIEGVKFARRHAEEHVKFVPEISSAFDNVTDEELALRVSQFASEVQNSISAFTDSDCLLETMARYPFSPCSGLVFVSRKAGGSAAQIFDVLVTDIQERKKGRKSYDINYKLLEKGDVHEIRFVLGKVIVDTVSCGVIQGEMRVVNEDPVCTSEHEAMPVEVKEQPKLPKSDPETREPSVKEKARKMIPRSDPELMQERTKKQKLSKKGPKIAKWALKETEILSRQVIEEERKKVLADDLRSTSYKDKLIKKKKKVEELLSLQQMSVKKDAMVKEDTEPKVQKDALAKDSRPRLSGLFPR